MRYNRPFHDVESNHPKLFEQRTILFTMPFPMHNVLFVQYVFLPTEQTETYFKICILTYDLTYICPGLFDWKENTFFFIFVYFKL